jgi:hypothetical protein
MTNPPSNEPVLQDKIRLLMEETGCDQGQAELAMASAGYDVEKAIRTIESLLRNIMAVRAKFIFPDRNIYGLLIFIADTKRESFYRLRAVVSYNPALYETPLDVDWFDFERRLYAFRLWEGTLQQMTQELEPVLLERLEKEEGGRVYAVLRDGSDEELRERLHHVLAGYYPGTRLELAVLREELNLEQFRRLKPQNDTSEAAPRPGTLASPAHGNLQLEVHLQQDADGIPARDVQAGDSVYVLLTDARDIAQYLSKLLGGRQGEAVRPLVAPVEEVVREKGMVSFRIRLSTGILGTAQAQEGSLLRVHKLPSPSWWRRLIPFA